MKNETGGPAFPTGTQVSQNNATDETTIYQYLTDGMTLRDYFAAKAMQGALAGNHPITHEYDVENLIAEAAYKIADAMLKARQQK